MTASARDPLEAGGTLGAVLAGGASHRFGSNKALAPFRGEPMAVRAVRTVREVCDRVALVGAGPEVVRAVARTVPDVQTVADRTPGAGPLGGLHAALHRAREEGCTGVLLLACDMPLVSSALASRVVEAGTGGDRPAAVPVASDGRAQPLCGWYATSCLSRVEARLTGDDRSMFGLLDDLEPTRVPVPAGEAQDGAPTGELRSVNTPAELRELEGARGPRPEARGPAPDPPPQEAPRPVPPTVLVVGFKDSGKTTVAVRLATELVARGHRVGSVKHGHRFRLDTPGTDSWRLANEGGADPVLLAGPEGFALMGGWPDGEPRLRELLALHLAHVDVAVVEGYKDETFPGIEVHRAGSGEPLLCRRGRGADTSRGPRPFLAVVSDDPDSVDAPDGVPVLGRDAPDLASRLADRVEEAVLERRPGRAARG